MSGKHFTYARYEFVLNAQSFFAVDGPTGKVNQEHSNPLLKTCSLGMLRIPDEDVVDQQLSNVDNNT